MSINTFVDSIESIASKALSDSKAVISCPAHPDVILRTFDKNAEDYAYALASNAVKADFLGDQGVMKSTRDAVQHQLEMADDECNICIHNLSL